MWDKDLVENTDLQQGGVRTEGRGNGSGVKTVLHGGDAVLPKQRLTHPCPELCPDTEQRSQFRLLEISFVLLES